MYLPCCSLYWKVSLVTKQILKSPTLEQPELEKQVLGTEEQAGKSRISMWVGHKPWGILWDIFFGRWEVSS